MRLPLDYMGILWMPLKQQASLNQGCYCWLVIDPDYQGKIGLILHNRLPWWLNGKESICQCRRPRRHWFDPWLWKIPGRKKCQPPPLFLPGRSHGQRSLAGYSPQGLQRVRHNWSYQHRVRAATSIVFTQANQGCMVLALLTPQEFPQEWSTAKTNGGEFIWDWLSYKQVLEIILSK